MRFLDLYISGFGKFHNTSVTFEDGLNLVYGKNEAGKSTIHTFIRGMLFGIERQRGRAAKSDLYSKYEPWENSGTYEGQLRLESGGMVYRIERSFQKNKKEFTIINETTGRETEPTKSFMDDLLCGLSETAYNNTISISQLKSATENGMISELKNYIANMNTSGNMALNITKATTYLKNQKKQLESQLMPEAARTYASLLSEIRNCEKEISSPEYENQMQEYQNLRYQLKEDITLKQMEKDELADKVLRGRQVLDEFNFSDEAAIAAFLNHTEEVYKSYNDCKESLGRKSSRFLPAAAFLLAALLGGCAAIFFYQHRFFAVSACIGAVLFLLIGSFKTFKSKKQEKEVLRCTAALSDTFKRHLGDDAISEAAIDALRSRLGEFSRLCQMITKSETTLKSLTEDISALRKKQNDYSEVIEQQQHIQWELEKKLEHLSDCKDRAAALKHVIAENDRIRQEIAAIELAQDTMKELSMSIRDSFGLYLNKTASELIQGITGDIYSSMSIDENLNAYLNTSRKLIPLEQVSSGTADQIYLALRLAAAKLIQTGEDAMPLIFDDSFVLYDDDRLKTALKWIAGAYKGQIIIFTCHQREQKILDQTELPYHYIQI